MPKGQSLQEPFLNVLRKERIPVAIYLVNGIKLQGQIESFDQFVVLLKIMSVRWFTSMLFQQWYHRELLKWRKQMKLLTITLNLFCLVQTTSLIKLYLRQIMTSLSDVRNI